MNRRLLAVIEAIIAFGVIETARLAITYLSAPTPGQFWFYGLFGLPCVGALVSGAICSVVVRERAAALLLGVGFLDSVVAALLNAGWGWFLMNGDLRGAQSIAVVALVFSVVFVPLAVVGGYISGTQQKSAAA